MTEQKASGAKPDAFSSGKTPNGVIHHYYIAKDNKKKGQNRQKIYQRNGRNFGDGKQRVFLVFAEKCDKMRKYFLFFTSAKGECDHEDGI
ncbi:MAG: hypothetical protein IK141_07775 [Clostridia bacterium]|nr:hypothetical protein [Clostridia bacterium]